MGGMPERNQSLRRILEDMRLARDRAGEWVQSDADFDPESRHLMNLMNDGDQGAIAAFIEWIDGLEDPLPVTAQSHDGGRRWTLDIDPTVEIAGDDRDMVEAMNFMFFGGPEPGPENSVANELTGLGLPERLRRDLGESG